MNIQVKPLAKHSLLFPNAVGILWLADLSTPNRTLRTCSLFLYTINSLGSRCICLLSLFYPQSLAWYLAY